MAVVIGLAILFFALGFLSGHLCTYEGEDAQKMTEIKKERKNLKNAYQGLRMLLPSEIVEVYEGKKQGEIMTAEEYFKSVALPFDKSGKTISKELKKYRDSIEKLEAKIEKQDVSLHELNEEKSSLQRSLKDYQEELAESRKGEKPEIKKLRDELSGTIREVELKAEKISDLEKVLEERASEIGRLENEVAVARSEVAAAARVTETTRAEIRFDKYVGARGAMNILKIEDEEEFMKIAGEEEFPKVAASFGETKLWLKVAVEEFAGRRGL